MDEEAIQNDENMHPTLRASQTSNVSLGSDFTYNGSSASSQSVSNAFREEQQTYSSSSESSDVEFLGGHAAPKRNAELTLAWGKIFSKAVIPTDKVVLSSLDANTKRVSRKRPSCMISRDEKTLRAEGNSIDISKKEDLEYGPDETLEYTLEEHLRFLDFRPEHEIGSSRRKDYLEILEEKLEKEKKSRKKKKTNEHCTCCLCAPHLYPGRGGDDQDGDSGQGGAPGPTLAC